MKIYDNIQYLVEFKSGKKQKMVGIFLKMTIKNNPYLVVGWEKHEIIQKQKS